MQIETGGISHFYHPGDVHGDTVHMKKTHEKHFGETGKTAKSDNVAGNFANMFNNAFNTVNSLQTRSDKLAEKIVYDPNSVDAHTVMIATEKARISLMFTKSVVDQVIRAYRELINMR